MPSPAAYGKDQFSHRAVHGLGWVMKTRAGGGRESLGHFPLPFLTALNAPKGPNGDEVTPGVRWMTLRSDHNDKFAQPDGVWIGARGTPTNVTADGPALKGAENVVLPGRDHREVSYHAEAFAQAWRFVTDTAPATTAVAPQARVTLDGLVTGFTPAGPTNLPLAGAEVSVYAVDPATGARRGEALMKKTVAGEFRSGAIAERIVGRTWPVAAQRVTVL